MKKTCYLLVFCICILGCKNKEHQLIETAQDTTEVKSNPVETADEKPATTFDLLQGTWTNVADPLSALIFDGVEVKNQYNGVGNKVAIEFSVGTTCLNGSHPEVAVVDREYISTTGDATECYAILQLDQDSLVLEFLGSGVTLTFKRT